MKRESCTRTVHYTSNKVVGSNHGRMGRRYRGPQPRRAPHTSPHTHCTAGAAMMRISLRWSVVHQWRCVSHEGSEGVMDPERGAPPCCPSWRASCSLNIYFVGCLRQENTSWARCALPWLKARETPGRRVQLPHSSPPVTQPRRGPVLSLSGGCALNLGAARFRTRSAGWIAARTAQHTHTHTSWWGRISCAPGASDLTTSRPILHWWCKHSGWTSVLGSRCIRCLTPAVDVGVEEHHGTSRD